LLFILSIVIAIAASVAALWIAFQLRLETILSAFWRKAGSALVMGAAISGMHYTGMAAANFAPNSLCVVSPQDINNVWLAGSIGGFTFMLLAATLLISVFDLRAYEESVEKTKAQKGLRQVNIELDAMVRELTVANAELEAFAYTIAHDLRAPLRHITGFAESLRQHSGHSLDAEGSRLLNVIHNSAAKQAKLIDNLLIYAKTGQHTLKIETVQLCPLVQEIRHELSLALGPSDTTEWRTASLPSVIGDIVLLRQVFYNLLSNAVKFTRKTERPIIEIGVQPGEVGRVLTFVRDNGAGFDMRYAGNLFGVFKRLHNNKEFEGTGIGLAHVRRIVQRLGGRVWAQGKVNEGATLYVDLPRGENQA
jgi:signal transduction histidine kinase